MEPKVFEDEIIHANICLKRWQVEGKQTDWDSVRSLILTWLNRAYTRYYGSFGNGRWRERKAISRGLADSMFFTVIRGDDIHINSIDVKDRATGGTLAFPSLDYAELNKLANARLTFNPALRSLDDLEFKNIQSIKFT